MTTEYRTVVLTASEIRALIRLIEDATPPMRARAPLETLKRAKGKLQSSMIGPPSRTPQSRVLDLTSASRGNRCECCKRAIAPGLQRCRPCLDLPVSAMSCGCPVGRHPETPNYLAGSAERDGPTCRLGWPCG